MSKTTKKRKIETLVENNYSLRSKSNRNKNVVKYENEVNLSLNCEQINQSINVSNKLTKMPTKTYNLRRRGITSNDNSYYLRQKTSNLKLNDLPDDCLLLIFERLDTIRDKCFLQSVNKRFYELINRLLRSQKVLSVNSTFGPNLKNYQTLSKSMCNNVIMKCPNLKVFKMPGFYAKDNTSTAADRIGDNEMRILSRCKDLRELDICGCGNVSEYGVNDIVRNCPNLEKLSISFCSQISGVSFKFLTKRFKQLTLNGNDMSPQLEHTLNALSLGEGKHLTELNVCLYHTLERQDHILEKICTYFRDLECLRYSIFSRNVCKFGSFGQLTNLTHLAFDANSFNLNDEELIKILKGCNKLISLFIRYEVTKDQTTITDFSLRKVPLFCPNIEKLHLHSKNDFITEITDISVFNLIGLKKLESLSLKSFENIGDSVINVIKCCPKLDYIFLLNCQKVTNATIDALITAAKAQPLKKIKFSINGDKFKYNKKKLPPNLIDCSIP